MLRPLALLVLVVLLLPGCTLVDIRTDSGRAGVSSSGLVKGYATYGWSDQESLLQVELLGGRSRGSILMIDLWKLAQVELGLLGASAGIGPLNAGLGILFYKPVPPFGTRGEWTPPAPDAPEPPATPAAEPAS